jgi:hypothetical protein
MLFCLFGIFGIYRYRTENTDTELPRYRIFFGTDRYQFRLEPNLPQYRSTEPIGSVIPNAQGEWPPSPKRSDWRCCGRIEECVRDVVSSVRVSMSPRRGGSPSFYRPRRGRFTGMPHYLATGGGMACSSGESVAVLTVLATILSSWRVLYPNSGSFEGRDVVVDRSVLRRARGSR